MFSIFFLCYFYLIYIEYPIPNILLYFSPLFFLADYITAVRAQFRWGYGWIYGSPINPALSKNLEFRKFEGLLKIIEQLQQPRFLTTRSLDGTVDSLSNTDEILNTLTTIQGKSVQLEREVSRGDFGIVYQGRYGDNKEVVAVKRFTFLTLEGKKCQAFLNAARIMMSLDSPYVLGCRDLIIAPQNYCLVVEYMPRGSLWDVLRQPISLRPDQQLAILQDIVHGLSILHDRGIVHRNLKSSNVLLDEQYRAKVADFDLTNFKMETNYSPNTLASMTGTLAWLAPEIVRDEKNHSKATDIYSLGLVIWVLVTCSQPFEGKELVDIVRVKMLEQHEEIPTNCSPHFSRMMCLCWKSPSERPSAKTLIATLQETPDASTYSGGMRLRTN